MESDPAALVGRDFGNYRTLRLLGQGGVGAVYEAQHPEIGRRAAIKVLRPELAQDAEAIARFFREARAVNQVRHANVVQVLDLGRTPEGTIYAVMELLEGESLAARLSHGPLALDAALLVFGQCARALQAVHAQGIVHRDLKPDNIFLAVDPESQDEVVKILDFGIARVLGGGDPALSKAGAVMGTPLYMSPEQCEGAADVDARADVYAMGCVLYHMLAGRPPFVSTSMAKLLLQHLTEVPQPLDALRADAPEVVVSAVGRALSKRPADRQASIAELARELARASGIAPDTAELLAGTTSAAPRSAPAPSAAAPVRAPAAAPGRRRWPWLALAMVASAGLAAAAWRLTRRGRQAPVAAPRERVDAAPTAPAAPAGMVLIPGGSFTMGSTPSEVDAAFAWCRQLAGDQCLRELYQRELPAHSVVLSPFYLDIDEVTNRSLAAWLSAQPDVELRDDRVRAGALVLVELAATAIEPGAAPAARFVARPADAELPVVGVTWDGADRFCRSRGHGLPTEAQWERAARGGDGRRFPWGDQEPRCDGVSFGRLPGGPCAAGGPRPAGSAGQDVSLEGVRDLAGNVAEWVRDGFTERYSPCAPACVDPLVTGGADELRALRGGYYDGHAEALRGAGRSRAPRGASRTNLGFRCAAPVAP